MSKNKIKNDKQKGNSTVLLKNDSNRSPTDKIKRLMSEMNDFMYDSLQKGNINIHDPQKTAKTLIKSRNQDLIKEILKGNFEINTEQIPFKSFKDRRSKRKYKLYEQQNNDSMKDHSKSSNLIKQNPEQINLINKNLKQLHQNIQKQRQQQRQQRKCLEQKAKSFIIKMKKQKQQLNEKLKSKRSHSRIFVRAISEDTIRVMKEKLEQKVLKKRQQLAQKVENIQNRKHQRIQAQVNNEIQYWEKVKRLESQKTINKAVSQRLLPRIQRNYSSKQIKHEKNKNMLFEKLNINRYENQSGSSEKRYSTELQNKVLKAKLKLQNFQIKFKNPQLSSIKRNQLNNIKKDSHDDLFISNKSLLNSKLTSQLSNHNLNSIDPFKIKQGRNYDKILNDFTDNQNKHNKPKFHRELLPLLGKDQRGEQNQALAIDARHVDLTQNPLKLELQEQWESILKKIKFHQIKKFKGLSMLGSIERKLDRIDRDGVSLRLKRKHQTIEQLQKEVVNKDQNGSDLLFHQNQVESKVFLLGQQDIKNNNLLSQAEIFNNQGIPENELSFLNSKSLQTSHNQFIQVVTKQKKLKK